MPSPVQRSPAASWKQVFDEPVDLQIAIPEAIGRSKFATANPHEADFFLVHAYLYCARPFIPPTGATPVLSKSYMGMPCRIRTFMILLMFASAKLIGISYRWNAGTDPHEWNRATAEVTLSYIQNHYPHWNRTGGQDHIWIVTQDHG
jgi:hypothetical protein